MASTARSTHAAQSRCDALDLSENIAGAAARARLEASHAEAPVLNFCARVMGLKTDEQAWRIGAVGEEMVGHRLEKLGPQWEVLHSIEVGDEAGYIDHAVIGPPGVFTVSTKHRPHGKAVVDSRCVWVNGLHTHHVRNSRHEARRAAWLLTEACHFEVPVTPVIVFVDLTEMRVKQMPDDVHVTSLPKLLDWLESRPAKLSPATVAAIHQRARWSTTWY
jgi:hypothetical protein